MEVNLNKSMLIVEITNGLGADIEDRLETEISTRDSLVGGADALGQAAVKVHTDLAAKAKDDANIKDGLSEMEVKKIVLDYLLRAGDYLKSMSLNERQKAITQGGRVEGMQAVVVVIKKKKEIETKKLQTLIALANEQQAAEEKGEEPPRTVAEMARREHGSAVDRRADAKATKIDKKKTAKKKTAKKKTAKKKTVK